MQATLGAEGFVLAGGQSRRMGQEKARVLYAGRPLIEIALEKLRALPLARLPRIAGARSPLSSYAEVVADLHAESGPLAGIEAALSASMEPLNLFLPVDVPLLPTFFLDWMLRRAIHSGALLTMPRVLGFPQPLCAVLHRDLLPAISGSIASGDLKVMPVLAAAAAALGGSATMDIFDTESIASTNEELTRTSPLRLHRWFHNCNTPQDMARML